jgi:hypothetical protein
MQHKRGADEKEDFGVLSDAESERESQLDTGVLRQVARTDVPPSTPSEEPWTVFAPQRAMAVSAPGSEYWLP